MKKYEQLFPLLLVTESISVVIIGCFAINNARSCHQVYTQLGDAQNVCQIMRHALVENIKLINDKDVLFGHIRTSISDSHIPSTDSTIFVILSMEGCGGCAISLVSQLIDDGRNDIIIIVESSNMQIESAFANDNKVTINTVPQLFDDESPPCRVIYQKHGIPQILSYYSEMAEYLDFILQ